MAEKSDYCFALGIADEVAVAGFRKKHGKGLGGEAAGDYRGFAGDGNRAGSR